MRNIVLKLALMALSVATVPAPALAAQPAPAIYVAADGLAAGGYDVTAYFTQGKAVRGSTKYELMLRGATWRFASPENKARFQADPAAYAPQFGGYCAWAVSQGYIASGDPEQWKIVDGKLYLNFNARAKELWEADQADAIKRGHANWPAVLTDNQDSQ
ncbi:MAG: YHS domain-containing (seleno)protein [Sphingomicrobium sp.]